MHVNVFDPDVLVAPMPQSAKSFDLRGVGPHQPGRRGRQAGNAPFWPDRASEPSEYRHGGRVAACHLNGECAFNFVSRCGALDHGEGGVDRSF